MLNVYFFTVFEEEIIKPSKKTRKIGIFKGLWYNSNVACSNEASELYYKPLNMPILRVFCWALLFLFRLRFPPGTSVARILRFSNN